MRFAALTLIGSLTLAAAALPANAAPAIARADAPPMASNVIEVSGGCGWGAHRGYYGYCRPNYYNGGGYAYGYGYPRYRYWHHW